MYTITLGNLHGGPHCNSLPAACALARVERCDVIDSYTAEVYFRGDTLTLTPGGKEVLTHSRPDNHNRF